MGARTKQTLHARGLDVLSGAGRSTLGPRGRSAPMARRKHMSSILGAEPVGWDNSRHYDAGTVVYNDGKYYRALRDIDPPFLPSLFDGEVPGQSHLWREIPQAEVINGCAVKETTDAILGRTREMLGMLDINVAQRNMNALTPVTVEIARVLLKGGQEAINGAIAGAKQPWYKADLPGDTARKNAHDHLQWHADKLDKMRGDTNEQQTNYSSGSDLKKWVMEAYIEGNAVEEGAAYLEESWNAMWTEIQTKLLAIPHAVAQALVKTAEAAGGALGAGAAAALGVPTWAFWLGSAAVVGGLGYVAYKVATGPVGGAVAHHYLGRR